MVEKTYGRKLNLPDKVEKARKWDVVCGYIISQFNLCKEFNCLPSEGGLNDQDWLIIYFFEVIASEISFETKRMSDGIS